MATEPLTIECGGDRLIGVLHQPANFSSDVGVVVIVGGPQYRVGSHRQFLMMARAICAAGYPILRFDYRGMGDSEGVYRGFEFVESDVRAAIDALVTRLPGVRGVVLLGLCDGASAALMYAPVDPRVRGLILLNTWVHTTRGEARAYLSHYYGRRIMQRSFWRGLLAGSVNLRRSVLGLLSALRLARAPQTAATGDAAAGFIDRMRAALEALATPVLLLESDRDLTAAEFAALRRDDAQWRIAAGRANVTTIRLENADHTFSERPALDAAVRHCIDWLGRLRGAAAQTCPRSELARNASCL